jgi:hypothetical protein
LLRINKGVAAIVQVAIFGKPSDRRSWDGVQAWSSKAAASPADSRLSSVELRKMKERTW